MSKHSDIDDLIDQWHDGAGEGQPLSQFLGMSTEEYSYWLRTNELPERLRHLDPKP